MPKTILDDLISLEGAEPCDLMARGVVYFQSAMLSTLLIYFYSKRIVIGGCTDDSRTWLLQYPFVDCMGLIKPYFTKYRIIRNRN